MTAIVNITAELGYSGRSICRRLSKLWATLGRPRPHGGLRKAYSEGLID